MLGRMRWKYAGGHAGTVLHALLVVIAVSVGASCDETIAPTPGPALCPTSEPLDEPASPLDFGRRELARAGVTGAQIVVGDTTADVVALLARNGAPLDARPESFVLVSEAGTHWIVGRDEVGAMYGALELAERWADGPMPRAVRGSPAIAVRGYNPYVTLPDRDERCWYFSDASYWSAYLDMLARSRINFLDLHAMYDLESTLSPNPLLWFGVSASFPDVGRPLTERRSNQSMLATIVAMARRRGISVGFLAARSDLAPAPRVTTDRSLAGLGEPELQTYTREAIADLLDHVPGLARIGARIGEGAQLPREAAPGDQASWYRNTYLPALAQRDARFYTRSWLSTRPAADALLEGARDPWLEVKFSAEHFGTPYPPQPSTFANGPTDWRPSYLYESYLDGPPPPYRIVFQLWLSATYRFFRYASFERTRSAISSMAQFGDRVAGFSIQAAHAYSRQRDYWHADPNDRLAEWTFVRDELEPWLFGRLGYEPSTPEVVLRRKLYERTGVDALWDLEQAGSDIVATIVSAHACGPDSRDFSPQLEWTGPISMWAAPARLAENDPSGSCLNRYHGPLDPFSFAGPFETAESMLRGVPTAKVTSLAVAARVLANAARLRDAERLLPNETNPWTRDVVRECSALGALGEYFGYKLRAATWLAVHRATGREDFLAAARDDVARAIASWQRLTDVTSYVKPFADPYRMNGIVRKETFHFRDLLPFVQTDERDLLSVSPRGDVAPNDALPSPPSLAARFEISDDITVTSLSRKPVDGACRVEVRFGRDLPENATVTLLSKPWEIERDWDATSMTSGPKAAFASVPGGCGKALLAFEVRWSDADGTPRATRAPHPFTLASYLVSSGPDE